MKRYSDFTDEEKQEYHRLKHKEYRDRNRERYRAMVNKSLKKNRHKYFYKRKKKKIDARQLISRMKILDKIKSKNCVFCGEEKTETHHPDYDKPKFVYWMCNQCHSTLHRILKKTKL